MRPRSSAFGSAIDHRPPSPARAAVPNTNTVVAGEGRGWGNNKLPSGHWHVTAINHPSPNPGGRPQLGVRRVRRLPMRSVPALNPNGHAPALIDVQEAPTSSPSIELKSRANHTVKAVPMREPTPTDRWRVHTAWEDGGRAVLQDRPALRPASPLSRASRCAKHIHRRRGGGAGVGDQQVAVPRDAIDPPTQQNAIRAQARRTCRASQANVWRQPHGGSVVSTTAGRTRPGSPITAKQNQRNTRQNAAFASPSRSARVHQPADAGRSPASTWSTALPPSSHAV